MTCKPLMRPACAPIIALVLLLFAPGVAAQPTSRPTSRPWQMTVSFIAQWPDDRLASPEGQRIVENLLTWQNPNGGWWKGYTTTAPRPTTQPTTQRRGVPGDDAEVWHQASTIDNGATYSEMRILARANQLKPDARLRQAFGRGLNFLLTMQYPNGGWPQRFPLQENYGRHITFNDNAMVNVLALLRDIADGKPEFGFVSDDDRARARSAYDKGVECILNCQIKVNGKLTAWCAQHDEVTLAPAGARTYELPSISGSEGAAVCMLLMEIPHPDERVKQAVVAAHDWFDAAKIVGKRMAFVRDESVPGGRDRKIVDDPQAPPQWARFYDIETNRPFYCGRDGVKRWSLAEVEPERRNGYQWMRPWAAELMERYPAWATENAINSK